MNYCAIRKSDIAWVVSSEYVEWQYWTVYFIVGMPGTQIDRMTLKKRMMKMKLSSKILAKLNKSLTVNVDLILDCRVLEPWN